MNINVLASSSSGNCYSVSDGATSVLLDCGLRFKKIQQLLDFKLSNIDGILLSHAHLDHSRSVPEMLKAGIDVYMAQDTADAIQATGHRVHIIESRRQLYVGGWYVLPFELRHDVTNYGYLLQSRATGERLLYATDTCYLPYTFSKLNYILLEVNHCRETLDANVEAGIVDISLRNRIVANHLSLETALGFFKANDMSQVKGIWLLHLSNSNSQAEQILKAVRATTGKETKIA